MLLRQGADRLIRGGSMLDSGPRTGRVVGRAAEVAGELAHELGVVADDLVERVLDQLTRAPAGEEGARARQQARRLLVAHDGLAVEGQDVPVDGADDAGVAELGPD